MMTITGLNNVLSNLNRYKSNINSTIPIALDHGLQVLKNNSIKYLVAISHSPMSDDAIRDSSNWHIKLVNRYEKSLVCNSGHAAVVEFGSYSGVPAKHYLGTTAIDISNINQQVKAIRDELVKVK